MLTLLEMIPLVEVREHSAWLEQIAEWKTETDRRDVLAAGMNAHLTKPLDPEQLRASLASFR